MKPETDLLQVVRILRGLDSAETDQVAAAEAELATLGKIPLMVASLMQQYASQQADPAAFLEQTERQIIAERS